MNNPPSKKNDKDRIVQQSLTYRDCGVDLDYTHNLIETIKDGARPTSHKGVLNSLGGFAAVFDAQSFGIEDPLLVSSTDGVGTKLRIAIQLKYFDAIGIDLVAMCVNDIFCHGAKPLFFLDYFSFSRLPIEHAEAIMQSVTLGCAQAGCPLVGGETAQMPDMYISGDFDLAGFCVGAVSRKKLLPSRCFSGDVVLALPSSGIHSNGFSLVRKLIDRCHLSLEEPAPFHSLQPSMGKALLTPTRIYSKATDILFASEGVRAIAHITGGGITENLPRVLPEDVTAEISLSSWKFPPVFEWLQQESNLDNAGMLETFNCGVGMMVICEKNAYEDILNLLAKAGEPAWLAGEIHSYKGERIRYTL